MTNEMFRLNSHLFMSDPELLEHMIRVGSVGYDCATGLASIDETLFEAIEKVKREQPPEVVREEVLSSAIVKLIKYDGDLYQTRVYSPEGKFLYTYRKDSFEAETKNFEGVIAVYKKYFS